MISQLTIQNFGLIDKMTVELAGGLNIFTGETGAGKSILIDALRFALGERLVPSLIRDQKLPCMVEAVFELSNKNIKDFPDLGEYISDEEKNVIINRTVSPDGKNRVKLNGFTITVSQLKAIGDHLVDFHGPNDHQMLLSSDSHIGILDRLCDLKDIGKEYSALYREYSDIVRKISELKELSGSRERELDMITHQLKELEQVSLGDDEYEKLSQEQSRMNNSEKLFEYVNSMIDLLENPEYGVVETSGKMFDPMEHLNEIDSATRDLYATLESVQCGSSELLTELRAYAERLEFDPDVASEVNRKMDIYYEILRKYAPSLEEVRIFYNRIKEKYALLSDMDGNDSKLKERLDDVRKKLSVPAQKITKERKRVAQFLKGTIEKELKELGIEHVQFECRIEKADLDENGQDRVVFYISPNAGEELKPLAEIVSSGEASRLMLALKKALTKVDPIPVLIFDEIDAQIGGRLGTVTGKKLKELSSERQVLLITHLPQIASFADKHLKVTKKVSNNHTSTVITCLDDETSRVDEIAKMMSGDKSNDISLKHAKEMLAAAQKK
ncbi:MAG TPA: DNA repair protein RecN [Candidatus Omnitrophota bacterium]|nr:DNA repair protein RecN [Candidatus Omnitrophota bacterium]